jgi:hypothetical protein
VTSPPKNEEVSRQDRDPGILDEIRIHKYTQINIKIDKV